VNDYISLKDVAATYGVTTRTVRNWISQGLLTAYKRNNHAILIDPMSLDGVLTMVRGGSRG
jgi:predicted site-specific integrase-resolvase